MPTKIHEHRVHPPDGGWGWFIVLGLFINISLTFGSLIVYPLFYFPLMREFNVGLGEVTWLSGCTEIGRVIGYSTAATMISKLGFRVTGFLISVLSGVSLSVASFSTNVAMVYILAGLVPGISVAYSSTMHSVLISRYFVKKRLLALGMSITGSPVGTLILSPLLQFFIDHYGWRGAMLLFGGISLNSAVATALYRPISIHSDPEPADDTESNSKCTSLWQSIKQVLVIPWFWLSNVIWFAILSGWVLYMRFLVPYSQKLDVDPIRGSLLLSAYSIVSLFSRFAFGALGGRKSVNIVWVLIVTESLVALTTALIWFADSFLGLMLNCVAHSLVSGGMHSMYVLILTTAVGDGNLAWGFTLTGLTYGTFGSLVTPSVGMLVDAVGEIRLAFVVSASLTIFAVLLHIPFLKTRQQSDDSEMTRLNGKG